MKLLKKIFIMILTIVLVSGIIPLRNCRTGDIREVNAQVNMTAEESIEWAKSKVGQAIDVDGVYGAQCVDLIKAYYTFLGFRPVQGNGSDYTHNVLPPGYVRIQGAIPRKGDILVYTGGAKGYGHVAIYESVYSTYHQNFGGNQYVMHITERAYPGIGKNHGYEATFNTGLIGNQPIYAYAVNKTKNCRVLIGRGYVDIKKERHLMR